LCSRKDVQMPISEAVTKRRRRSFSPEFKREIVALCKLPDNNVASVTKEYDLTETAVRRWVHQAEVDAGNTFDTWVESRSSIPSNAQRSLRSLGWISRRENLLVRAGPASHTS
jgi:transposase-like protein